MIGYRRRIMAFGGVTYRLQVNVRNLFDNDEPVPTARTTTGAVAKLTTVEPRVIVVTFGVEL
jgi:outer membrane receptor protein involved in Fe transport